MGTVGKDFAPYAEWLDMHAIPRNHIKQIESAYTAQAFITTDQDDNQITAFHPGAMDFAHEVTVDEADGVTIGIVSPDGRQGMIDHAEQFVEAGIPFIFDPGQAMPLFTGDDFRQFIEQATWVCVNDYESQLLQDRTGWSPHEIAGKVDALIVTLGGKGSHVYHSNKRIDIPPAPVSAIVDPTGCGDAFRGGLLYGLMNGLDWEKTGRIGALMGAIKIEQHGTQNHTFTADEFRERYQAAFGQPLEAL
jgi:adenosine kinase